MERSADAAPQTQVLLLEAPPVYKSSLVYRPSDYYNATHRGGKYYDEDDDDVEAHADDEKAMLEGAGAMRKARRKRSCVLCCCTICYVVFILLLVTAILLIKLVPKVPALSLGNLNIAEFVYSQSENEDPQLKASLTFDLKVTSRNFHADTIYKEINLSLFFQDQSLGDFKATPQPQFVQKKKQTTSVVTDLAAGAPITIENTAADTLKTQAASSNVQVDVRGAVKGKLKVLGIEVKKFDIDITCKLNVNPGDGKSKAAQELSLTCY